MQHDTYSRRRFLRSSSRLALTLPLVGGLAATLAACGGDDAEPSGDEGGGTTVKQGFTTSSAFSSSYFAAFVAREKGFWSDRGLDIAIRAGQGSSPALQAVLGNSVQYGWSNPLDTIVAIAEQGAPVINIAQVNQRLNFAFASPSKAPLNDPKEWEGKKIGIVSSGGATEKSLDIALLSRGVDPKSVKRPITGVGAGAAELARKGAVDGWISEINDLQQLKDAGFEIEILELDPYVKVPATTLAATTKLVADQPENVSKFLGGMREAIVFAMDEANEAEVVKIVKKYATDVPNDKIAFELRIRVGLASADGKDSVLAFKPDAWEAGQKTMVDLGLVKKAVPVDRLINTELLGAAT
jgi:NitT/TauT family transport system substrate-binding protein